MRGSIPRPAAVLIILLLAVLAAYVAYRVRKARNVVGGEKRPAQLAPLVTRDASLRMARTRRGHSTRSRF